MIDFSLLGLMTDGKGQGAVVDGPITRTPDLESQESFRRRGLRRSPTSSGPLLPLPCEVDTQEGLHQCLCSLLLALFSPCPSELKSDPFPELPTPSFTQDPVTPGSKGQDSRLNALPCVVSTTAPGGFKSNSSSTLSCPLLTADMTTEGSDPVNGSGEWGLAAYSQRTGYIGKLGPQSGGPHRDQGHL